MVADFRGDDVDNLVEHFRHVLDEAGVQTSLVPDGWTKLKETLYAAMTILKQQTGCPSTRDAEINSLTS